MPGEIPGMMSWHSEVYRKDIPGRVTTQSYCYYRVIRIDDPVALPLFWRPAGLKYLGSKAGDEKGCVFACTQSEWDDQGPKNPIKGDIQYQTSGQSKYAESWGPQAGWTATDKGDLKAVPEAADPGSGSKTLVALQPGGVSVELETRVLTSGRLRYSVRNLGPRPVRVVWNIPKNDALSGVEGPFNKAGIELRPGQTFEHDAGQSGDKIMHWQTQVMLVVDGAPAVIVAIPAAGPSTGRFELNPTEFWQ
jgi:hypothetical protein